MVSQRRVITYYSWLPCFSSCERDTSEAIYFYLLLTVIASEARAKQSLCCVLICFSFTLVVL